MMNMHIHKCRGNTFITETHTLLPVTQGLPLPKSYSYAFKYLSLSVLHILNGCLKLNVNKPLLIVCIHSRVPSKGLCKFPLLTMSIASLQNHDFIFWKTLDLIFTILITLSASIIYSTTHINLSYSPRNQNPSTSL